MRAAADRSEDPFAAALSLNQRLFTAQPILLGVEHSRATGPMPCGLGVDMERARFARRGVVEMLNSVGEWEAVPVGPSTAPLGEAMIREGGQWRPALSVARSLDGRGVGSLCKLSSGAGKRYGRELPLGTRRSDGMIALAPSMKRALGVTRVRADQLDALVVARLAELSGGGTIVALEPRGEQLVARMSFADFPISAWRDARGALLLDPPQRSEIPPPCRACPELERYCAKVEIVASPASLWRQLGLVEANGQPTRRGTVFSFFHHGEGFAVAAALEDESYAIPEIIFDLANLRAGPRFAGDDSPLGGRLGALCQRLYERADVSGYLEMGVPLTYGDGAGEVIREIVEHGADRQKLLSESLRLGDIERAVIEWRSLLRHIVWAPDYDWARWRELKAAAAQHIQDTPSPALVPLPPLTAAQQRR